ncbi:helix-turn-helix domain-containing protein [Nonomuraea fuscirosea]|uniref:helix-turn-helix domain-containing protein n=1 Tax=Nonomuraea fuscirosea TaxID=1291556 RepID=UPI0011B1F618
MSLADLCLFSGVINVRARSSAATAARRRGAATSRAKYAEQAAGRREDYVWLREEQGHSIAQAAERMGVSYRQAQRWEALRRQERESAS